MHCRFSRPTRAFVAPAALLVVAMLLGAAPSASAGDGVPDLERVSPAAHVAGQPPADAFGGLSDRGIRHVINLRPPAEGPAFDEAAVVADAGMTYHNLPIAGAGDLTRENVRRLDQLLQKLGDEPRLLHCASGNRVGAMMALRSAWIEGASPEQALALGRRWGLTGLEDAVRDRLAR